MVGKTTENCADLGEKLDALYGHYKLHKALMPRIIGPSALATALGLHRSTPGRWVRTNEDTHRDAWQVSPEHILLLADLLVKTLHGTLDQAEAVRLWRHASAAEFKRRLIASEPASIVGLLERRAPTLKVECGLYDNSLGMVETEFEPVEGELVLKSGERFCLRAHARKGRSLIVLGEGPTGWSLLAPAPEYGGQVQRVPQPFPTRPPSWHITKSHGPHVIKVIEIAAGTAPIQRKRGPVIALLPEQEQLLIEELLDVNRSGDWRWGEARLFVMPPDEPV